LEKKIKINQKILILCIILLASIINFSNAQIVIIVNKDNPINNISLSELEQIYLGKRTAFSDGKNIILVEYAGLEEKFYGILFN